MSNNRASRKGVGVARSDHDALTGLLRSCGVGFGEATRRVTKGDPEYVFTGRKRVMYVSFETTSLVFDAEGRYVGRLYMARDECDYFTPRADA